MKIISFVCGPIRAKSYIVFEENSSNAVLIDAGGEPEKILNIASENGVKIDYVLLTHGHFDHVGACARLQKEGAKIFIHQDDEILVTTDKGECGFNMHVENFTPDKLLKGGELLELCGLKVHVLHTPGHTPGGVCYIIENNIFSGDTLFYGSYGRTDLGGDLSQLKDSIINKLFTLSGDFDVYPGHQGKTSLIMEKNHNPITYA